MEKSVIVVGAGLGGLSTALRLSSDGYRVTMVEKNNQAGGRLNLLQKDGFSWDLGPTFFSMSYEFRELMDYCGLEMPFRFVELDPLYAVHFADESKPRLIYKKLSQLANEFGDVEPDFEKKMRRFLDETGRLFHDTEQVIIRRNFDSILQYALQLTRVPLKHAPKLFRTMWKELERHFTSFEVKVIFSLVGFFLGNTPFNTPAVFTLLSYTEMEHDGYYNVEGGMYKIVTTLMDELKKRGVQFAFDTEIVDYRADGKKITGLVDGEGKVWNADAYVINADAAWFRGAVLKRPAYSEAKLDKMNWTMAPLTIYLGIKGKLDDMYHHNYFLRKNFEEYAGGIFENKVSLDQPYYYVNIPSMHNPDYAPEGHESVFILCPVPDRRYKPSWDDADEIADRIIDDFSERTGTNLRERIVSRTVFSPVEWESKFRLFRGSGLGLGHNLMQVGGLRPRNFDEYFRNVFYVGASTTPGTGLPMTVISSRLVTERINQAYGLVSENQH
ncbi:NAD(P)/FAD-dependent oxidoreductase [Prolixibacter sp. NT017]|uniref:phytoene desaturase family protein n=1 Tax=Prolixibacter sp. NT017 TaxID=2652390 RepID=UPI00127E0E17|nr:phytoene desaturase family protein [Prolixibacter sp. NT017]GET24228.1 phytoene desaturase [Prolixibacter sp. NT017]